MCNCIKEVNSQLAEHNGKLAIAFGLTADMASMKMRLMIATEKVDKTKRKPVPALTASFCPFCGEKAD